MAIIELTELIKVTTDPTVIGDAGKYLLTVVYNGQSYQLSLPLTTLTTQADLEALLATALTQLKDPKQTTNLTETWKGTYALTHYWVGGGGNWSDTAHWSSVSGGAGGSTIPTSSDNVKIDSNSGFGAGGTITLNVDANCNNFTANSGHSYNIDGTSANLYIYGSATFEAGLTTIGITYVYFRATTTGKTLTINGATLDGLFTFDGAGGGWTLQDNLSVPSLYLFDGTFDANDYNITTGYVFISASDINAPTVYMGSGTWEVTTDIWTVAESLGGIVTLFSETSTVKLSGFAHIFGDVEKTYYNLWIATPGTNYIDCPNTFNDLKIDAGLIVYIMGTQVVSSFTATGSAGNLITLNSYDFPNQFNLSKSSGTVDCDYLNLSNSNATGGATWNAGINSVNTTNNSGWIFTGLGDSSSVANFV